MFSRFASAIISLAFCGAALAPMAATAADSQTWKIRSFSSKPVELKFFSQNRRNVWPGATKVYVIRDYTVKSFPLACINGEKICYGAWLKGNTKSYWGVGSDGKQKCTSCCYTCNGKTETAIVNLNER